MRNPLHGTDVNAVFVHVPQGRQITQTIDGLAGVANHEIDIVFGGETAEGKANRTVGELIAQAQCAQHIGWLQEAEVHAEPDDTASSFNAIINDSPSTKLKLTLRLPAMR